MLPAAKAGDFVKLILLYLHIWLIIAYWQSNYQTDERPVVHLLS